MFLLLHEANGGVPYITLNNGVKMPAVAAGTWQYNAEEAQRNVAAALEVGFTHIDTASDYCANGKLGDCSQNGGSNQVGIGKALEGRPRSSYFITTKVPGCGLQGIGKENCGADSVARANRNLAELGLEYVDLLLIHFPPRLRFFKFGGCKDCKSIRAQWSALTEGILRANKTRALGVSNYCQSCIECLSGTDHVVPAVNQFQYHIGMGPDPEGLVSYCKAKGIAPQAYSPLAHNTTQLITGPLVTKMGQAHNKTGVQVALRWIYQNGVAVTTKSGNTAHLTQDLDIFNWGLTDAEMAEADAAKRPKGTPSFFCTK